MPATRSLQLMAPLSGVLIPLDQVPDPVFSNKIVGDGICIDPTSHILCAPVAGVVSELQSSKHAITITHDSGVQVLLHIGLDTVSLVGEGFSTLVCKEQRVEAGQPLIEFDADHIALHARSLMTIVLVVTGEPFTVSTLDELVECGQPLMSLTTNLQSSETLPNRGQAVCSEPIILPNTCGLHARPAAMLVQAAKGFEADIKLHRQDASGNAKSLVSIMALQTTQGDVVHLSAIGADAQQAIEKLAQLIADGCGEAITPVGKPAEQIDPPTKVAALQTDVLRGVCASSGSAFGHVVQIAQNPLDISESALEPHIERKVLEEALVQARDALQRLQDQATGDAQAGIFKAHQELLQDPSLVEEALALIAKGKSAAFSWNRVTQAIATTFRDSGDALLAERALDLMDVGQRVLRLILGAPDSVLTLPDQAILIAHQLTPSQTATLDKSKVLGFATVEGGATSHVAILARAAGLPAICGLPMHVLTLATGTPVLLDADRGELHIEPDQSHVEKSRAKHQQQLLTHQQALKDSALPACTLDGHCFEVSANVASLQETIQAIELGGEGVGLLRSEFLYLDRASSPDLAEQASTYSAIASALGTDRNLIVRTLDVGGDKPLAYVPMNMETNPFLGMRGIRLCLARPQLLREQFRAILSSTSLTRMHIMLPMVSQLSELRDARQMLHEEAARIGLQHLPKLGIMIEVPSAALMADLFAPEVDFFSIGTNDLTQYTLAMDREHPLLASQADSFHPAVLRLIAGTVNAAHAHGKWVGVCGALASETLAVPLLLGLGVDELSVSVPLIPAIKSAIRKAELGRCEILAQQILKMESAEQVRSALQAHLQAYPEIPTALEN